ncbi:MAG: ADP-ribosyltransferase [Catonella sp.]|uniref:ADP-ribosyltransferase n=1 Tax=Catonella sp. TaxID=2382125 RepID=UPI003FA08DA1
MIFEGRKEATSNFSKTVRNVAELDSEEIYALIKYTGDNYRNINDSLRGLDIMTDDNKMITEKLKTALDRASLPNNMTLYRGTSIEALGEYKNLDPKNLLGKTINEKGFMSTSMNNSVAEETFLENMHMTIEAPKGSKGLDISPISQYPESETLFKSEQEIVITDAKVEDGVLKIIVKLLN